MKIDRHDDDWINRIIFCCEMMSWFLLATDTDSEDATWGWGFCPWCGEKIEDPDREED